MCVCVIEMIVDDNNIMSAYAHIHRTTSSMKVDWQMYIT